MDQPAAYLKPLNILQYTPRIMVDMIVIVQPEGFHSIFVSIALGFFPLLPMPAASNYTTVFGVNSLKPDVKLPHQT